LWPIICAGKGWDALIFDPAGIARILGVSEDSLKMRVANFKALAGGSGLDNFAELSAEIYLEYKDKDIAEHRAEVMEILK